MSPDQLTFDNPVERHSHIKPHASWQPLPGLDAELDPKADHGETSYRGTGRLPGRKALITGGDSGIGAAVAIAFAREGADVALSYLPEEQVDAEAIAAHVRAAGRTAVLLPGDIRDREFCRSLVADAVEGLGGLDILVNNAAHQVYHQSFDELDEADLDRTIQTNLYAMFWITRDALPHLGPGSTIINSTSVQGYNPSPMIINYASTKFGIIGFTKALAADLAPRGIRVNAVAPGPVWTPLQVSDGQPTGEAQRLRRVVLARPDEPAGRAGARLRVPRLAGVELRRGRGHQRQRRGERALTRLTVSALRAPSSTTAARRGPRSCGTPGSRAGAASAGSARPRGSAAGRAGAGPSARRRATRRGRPRSTGGPRSRRRDRSARRRRRDRGARATARAGARARRHALRRPGPRGPAVRVRPVARSRTAAVSSESCVQDRRLKLSLPTVAHTSSITQTFACT